MNWPNRLTVFRVILIPFFIIFMMIPMFDSPACEGPAAWISLGIFVIASLTDLLDGKIARKYNLVTNFGKFMDPIADKLLVCSALICLVRLERIYTWMVIVIVAREFIIGGFREVAAKDGLVIAASWWGKVKTVFQMIAVGLLIVCTSFSNGTISAVIGVLAQVFAWIATALTVISLADYVIKNRNVLMDNNK